LPPAVKSSNNILATRRDNIYHAITRLFQNVAMPFASTCACVNRTTPNNLKSFMRRGFQEGERYTTPNEGYATGIMITFHLVSSL
jgi:hypothetical protein